MKLLNKINRDGSQNHNIGLDDSREFNASDAENEGYARVLSKIN